MKSVNTYNRVFLKRFRDDLISIGLPLDFIEDQKKWSYFLEHFYFPEIPFRLDELSKESLTRFYHLLKDINETSFTDLKAQVKKLIN